MPLVTNVILQQKQRVESSNFEGSDSEERYTNKLSITNYIMGI